MRKNTDGSANRLSLGTVSATDPDGGSVTYSIAGGNESGRFELDAASGELFYTGGGEDYETGSTSFELTVRASDGDQTTDATVTVNVTDVDEPVVVDPPVTEPDQSTPQTVSEPAGEDFSRDSSTSGRIAVGDTATGRIGSSGDRDWFAVELVAGRTYVIDLRGSPTGDGTLSDPYLRGVYDADGDRISNTTDDDGGQSYNSRVTFTATESGTHYIAAGAYSSRQGTYEVEVTDTSPPIVGPGPDSGDPPDRQEQVQEQPPAFGSQFYAFDLAENADGSANRISLGTVMATDADGGSVTYSIEGGNAAALFEIDAASGEVFYTGGGEDYETGSTSFELTVRANDGDQTTDTTVTVNVTDVAEAPAFGQAGYAFDLAENADGSTDRISLGTVTATDPDGGSVTYSIAGGNESALFEIDAASGELFYTGGGEDYETGSTRFELTVRASDGDQTTDTNVTVNVTDVDEPVVVDPPVAQEAQSVSQTVSEPAGEDFARNSSTSGRVAVGDTATGRIGSSGDRDWFAVELEAGRTYVIDLRGSPTGDGTLSDPYLRGIYDADGDRISNTTDDDGGQSYNSRVTFTATESGTHYIAAGAYSSRQGTYELEVTDTSPPETPQEQIQQQPPAFGSQFYAFELEENADGSANRLSLGTVTATDPDGGSLTYSIAGGNAAGLFEIDAASGELFYTGGGEDYEAGSTSFNLTVRASDGDQTTDATVTVIITDVAEAPAFGQAGYAFDLAEETDGSANRLSLGTVTATDPDGGSVTYSIEAGNPGLFDIDAASGELFYVGAGEDYETGITSFNLTVRASDGDRTTDTSVTVNVTDVDEPAEDNPPVTEPDQNTPQTVSEPAGEDFPARPSTTGRVAVGGTATGNIDGVSDRDWFAVDLGEGSTYVIELRGRDTNDGTLGDPYLYGIYNPSGNYISGTHNDHGGEGWNSRVTFTAIESGTHFVATGVSGYAVDGKYTGTYTLAVSKVTDDLSAGTDTNGEVSVGGTATGEIEFLGDVDWYAVTLEAGKTYRFDLEGAWTSKGTLSSPFLRGLYDATGSRIEGTTDSNGGVYSNAQLYFTPTTGGTYYVAAGASADTTGTYTLGVAETAEDVAADTSTTATVAVGGTVTGEIESPDDRDWYAVTLEAGKTYRFDLVGDVNQSGHTLWDPHLWGLHDATGTLIDDTTASDVGTGRNSRLNFTADTSGTYYVAVGAVEGPYRDDTGSYSLAVDDITEDIPADTSTTATVSVNGPEGVEELPATTGRIETVRDRDWFAVTLKAGKTYRIDLEGSFTDKGTLYDPHIVGLYDANGDRIDGTIKGGGIGYNSHRYVTVDADGTYYVAAGTYLAPYVGSYTLEVTRLVADAAANSSTTATVTVGNPETGDIETLGDRDWYAVALEEGKTYRIDLEGTPTDKGTLEEPYLRGVYDTNGVLIDGTTDDDGGWINNSRVYFTAPANGTYYVSASSAHDNYVVGQKFGGAAGTYTLSVTELSSDVAADTDTTATLTVGSTISGEIEFGGDSDWFAVTLEEGKTYRFDLEGRWPGGGASSKGSLTHPHLRGIYDASGVLIDGTADENSGGYNSSQVYFTADASGTYYVSASEHYGDGTGTYVLTVRELEDDFFANTSTTATVAVGGTATGEIEFTGDRDWFAVTLEAGKTYQINLAGWTTDKGTLPDPYLRGIHDATGALIADTTDDDGGSQKNSRVEFTAVTSGTYYVAAGAFDDLTGSYTLTVEEVVDAL